MFFPAYFGPYGWLIIPGLLLGFYAQFKMSSSYNRFSEEPIQNGLSGAEAARRILDHAGLTDVPIETTEGHLTDHYDPGKRALFLSEENYTGRSVAAVGVAAHEAGHALQQQASYALFNFRMWLAPTTQIASFAYLILAVVGMILGGPFFSKFLLAAIILFSVITLFQVVTLPVEYDASRRAKEQLTRLGLVQPSESAAVKEMLSAAALTYVAGMVTSILTLLRLVMIFNRSNRD